MEEKNKKRIEFINSLKVDSNDLKNKQKKYDEYYIYKDIYKEIYKNHTLLEYLFLKQEFPNVDFDISIRMKSYISAKNKINKEIEKGKDGSIYDRLAKKYIIYSNNESKDEKDLIQACYNFKDALLYNFPAFLKDEYPEIYQKNIDFKLKDYIEHPKKTGYKSIHLSKIHREKNIEFPSETQIKTFRMREIEQYGSASHSCIYKDRHSDLKENELDLVIPQYMEIDLNKKKHLYEVKELSFSECFEKYFKYPYKIFLDNKEKLKVKKNKCFNKKGHILDNNTDINDFKVDKIIYNEDSKSIKNNKEDIKNINNNNKVLKNIADEDLNMSLKEIFDFDDKNTEREI